jgi:hypothetical protein
MLDEGIRESTSLPWHQPTEFILSREGDDQC